MDESRFDALTRRLSSRRVALGGLLGGLAALLRVAPKEADAHNPIPDCKTVKDPRKRLACLRRARRHNRNQHSCKPQPRAVTCNNRCGTTQNNCKKRVNCTCPAGKTCLRNQGCDRSCTVFGEPGDCPVGCWCGIRLVEAPTTRLCVSIAVTQCEQAIIPCVTSANCPRGHFCGLTTCEVPTTRCLPNCPF
jgi:hypothetical protein